MEKYRDKPFALLGVNSDEDRDLVKQLQTDGKVTWRSWLAGGTDGEIPARWQIDGWPTLYLIDADGVIRAKPSPEEIIDGKLERTIDRLLIEMEMSKKKG